MNLNIPITIALFLLVLYSILLATKGNAKEETNKGFRPFGQRLVTVNVIMLILLMAQHYHNRYLVKIKDQEYQIKQDTRDSIGKARYDSLLFAMKSTYDASNIQTITAVADALGKYGYKLDTANRRLVRILKESPKTKVIFSNDPVLSCSAFILCERTNGNSVYRIEIGSNDAGATGFDIMGNFLAVDSLHHKIYLGGKTIFDFKDRIPKDSINGFYMGIDNYSLYSQIFIRLSGSYKNMEGSKSFLMDDIIAYNIKDKTFQTAKGSIREEIIAFLENKGK
jgi:hypothetical protein